MPDIAIEFQCYENFNFCRDLRVRISNINLLRNTTAAITRSVQYDLKLKDSGPYAVLS